MLARFRVSTLSSAIRSTCSNNASSTYKVNAITSQPQLTTTQAMEVKRMPKTLRTKSAAKKRFRVTANGHLKCWPSSLHGKSRVIKRAGLKNSTAIHMTKLLSNHGWRHTIKSTAKSQYLTQDQEFDGI